MSSYQNHLTSVIGVYLCNEAIYIAGPISRKLINHIGCNAEPSRQWLNCPLRAAKLADIYRCYSGIFADMCQSLSAWRLPF